VILLPSPIPHPLDYCPFDLPSRADKLIESVVGIGWPAGNEAATWDVADRWYAAAGALAGTQAEAFAAAAQIMAGSDNDRFRDAWERLAGDRSAPLNALVEIAGEVGSLVEDCGRSLEAAKLSAWVEIGLLLNELTGMAIIGPLTMGAASPAADGMIAATKYAIAQIFSRLVSEIGTPPAAPPEMPGEGPPLPGAAGRQRPLVAAGRDDRPPADVGRPDAGLAHAETTRRLFPPATRAVTADSGRHRSLDDESFEDERPDPRFGLANARGLNCVDAVLTMYGTYLLGRPQAIDAYPHRHPGDVGGQGGAGGDGDSDHPTGGEWDGPRRIEEATGATFQNLCPYLGSADPADAKPAVDVAMRNLGNHLHNSGHGAFAVIVTDLEDGGYHCWAAINQDGAVLFLDPQLGRIGEEKPLYLHCGAPSPANVIAMDALVVDGLARPAPLPYHGPGRWTAAAPG